MKESLQQCAIAAIVVVLISAAAAPATAGPAQTPEPSLPGLSYDGTGPTFDEAAWRQEMNERASDLALEYARSNPPPPRAKPWWAFLLKWVLAPTLIALFGAVGNSMRLRRIARIESSQRGRCLACGSTELDVQGSSVSCRSCGYEGAADGGGALTEDEVRALEHEGRRS
ncbi:MAG: hypothetical protein KC561_08470 [Myxococcales bacterium]|nr:hypothetical protein [Myxococcales bacterium]